ncbi:MAG: hypothetical protein ABR569_05160 [Gaiellaceae bacterium]
MSRSLGGLLIAQALYAGAGVGVLSTLRRWETWVDFLQALGLAYLTGVASVGVLATLMLLAGFGLGTIVIIAIATGLLVAGCAVAAGRGFRPPRASGLTRPAATPQNLAVLVFAVITLLVLGAMSRAAVHLPVTSWDAWTFWVPKAETIYFFGLDAHLLTALANPSYPLFVPALQAMDFRLMGSADATALALQYWFLFAAFLLSVWTLLRPLVKPAVIWPFLALASVMPTLDKRLLVAEGDWPLAVLFAVAALCVARWLLTREPWLLGVFAFLASAAMATKREGQLLIACLLAAALATTVRTARAAWPRLLGLTVLAYLPQIPWRLWWTSRHVTPDTPEVPFSRLPSHVDRVGPALRIVLHLLVRTDMWLVTVPLALTAALLLLVARRDVGLAVLYLLTCALGVVGFVWVLWSFLSFPLDESAQEPIPRAVGSLVLLSAAFAPLLVSRLLAVGAHSAEQPIDLAPVAVDG